MYCTKCSLELASGALYCPQCGAKAFDNAPHSAGDSWPTPLSTRAIVKLERVGTELQKPKRYLRIIAVLIAIAALGFVFFANRSLENYLSDETLQDIAVTVKDAHGIIPCDVKVRVSGNAIFITSQLTVGVNTLLGFDAMRYYEELGIDQVVSQMVFGEEIVDNLTETCSQLEDVGFFNVEIVYEEIDCDGNLLMSRTFTSSG